jgi:hypothetical protein
MWQHHTMKLKTLVKIENFLSEIWQLKCPTQERGLVNIDPRFRSEWCRLDNFDVNDDVIRWYLMMTRSDSAL